MFRYQTTELGRFLVFLYAHCIKKADASKILEAELGGWTTPVVNYPTDHRLLRSLLLPGS